MKLEIECGSCAENSWVRYVDVNVSPRLKVFSAADRCVPRFRIYKAYIATLFPAAA
jgi:hypothetical protein